MERTFTLDDILLVATEFVEKFSSNVVFAFYGEMGAGKTTFIQALCSLMKVKSTVSSPTYAIINEYESVEGSIFHIDLYRLKDEEEVVQAGVMDCLYSGNTCFVEWPERAPGIFPDDVINVFLKAINEDTRSIRIEEN